MADNTKKKRDRSKSTLSNAQEIHYAREFRLADQAGGFTAKQARH